MIENLLISLVLVGVTGSLGFIYGWCVHRKEVVRQQYYLETLFHQTKKTRNHDENKGYQQALDDLSEYNRLNEEVNN